PPGYRSAQKTGFHPQRRYRTRRPAATGVTTTRFCRGTSRPATTYRRSRWSKSANRTTLSMGSETDMKYEHPLKQILSRGRSHWDQHETREVVRSAFRKALQCRTPELGAEVFASFNQELILYHTCKSKACPSC